MKHLTKDEEITALEMALRFYLFPDKYFVKADKTLRKRYCIAHRENGRDIEKSAYMTYEEFNHYLLGYFAKNQNKFI